MKQDNFGVLARALAHAHLVRAYRPGDYQVLADEHLFAALEGTDPLLESEYKALLESPLTLRRVQAIAGELRARRERLGQTANDEWFESFGQLRAAASESEAETLKTEGGLWNLGFLQEAGGWRVILRATYPEDPRVRALIEAGCILRVEDAQGEQILRGSLDAQGELEAAWPYPAAPYPHLMAQGGRFNVRRG